MTVKQKMATNKGICIMGASEVTQKIRRMASMLYEEHGTFKDFGMVGVWENGYVLAELLRNHLSLIANQKVPLACIRVQKKSPLWSQKAVIEEGARIATCKTILVVDDVLNTGRTLWRVLQTLMNQCRPSCVEVAVLVARNQKRFPVDVRYVGTALSTTLNHYVEARMRSPQRVYMYG